MLLNKTRFNIPYNVPIWVFERPLDHSAVPGFGVSVRISWGALTSELKPILEALLEFSKEVGGSIYDGQAGAVVTDDNIDTLLREFEKTGVRISEMLGKVSDAVSVSPITIDENKLSDP